MVIRESSLFFAKAFLSIAWALFGWGGATAELSVTDCSQGRGIEICPDDLIDFRSQIYPLLEQHCLKCHSSRQADGDLRLDEEMEARQGGHTGSLIFGPTAEESELFRRIISTEPGYRMPKRGAPLSPAEIELFRQWIAQGASYQSFPEQRSGEKGANDSSTRPLPFSSPAHEAASSSLFSLDGWVQLWISGNETLSRPNFSFFVWWGCLVAVWLGLATLKLIGAGVFWVRQLRHRRKSSATAETKPSEVPHPLGRFNLWASWKSLGVCLLILACSGVILYQRAWINELLANRQSVAETKVGRKQSSPPISLERSSLTLPTHPMHPSRLGGVYYRGNDERDPSLFNSGFYRTAEIEIWLIDSQGQRIQWGDVVTDRALSIELTIDRSPGTTPELFSQRIMSTAYLRRFRETPLIGDSDDDESFEIPLQVRQPDQQWSARIPLEPVADWSEGKNAGVVYLFYGPTIVDGRKGRIHYGIRYELEVSEGRLTNQSTLWMGSMYDLGGRVLIPQEGEVLLDHWFDFRPIPEIEGENPNQPELLGIPEHEF